MKNVAVLCPLLIVLWTCGLARAETAYVSDQVVISLREGKSSQDKAIKPLRTGTPLEILERDADKVHVKVRLQSGEEGYVPAQYVTSETPKQVVIEHLENELERLRAQLAASAPDGAAPVPQADAGPERCGEQERTLAEKLSAQSRTLAQAQEGLQAMTEKYKALLAKSEQAAAAGAGRDNPQKENAAVVAELQALRAENATLKNSSGIKWFLAGGGVLVCGWMIGRTSRPKRTSSRLLD